MTDSLNSLWQSSERSHGDRIALIQGASRWSYAELGALIRGVSAMLKVRLGLKRGEPVALLAPNGMPFVASYFGILGAGGAVQPIDARLSPTQRQARIQESHARVLLVHANFAETPTIAGSGNGPTHVVAISDEGMPRDDARSSEPVEINPGAVAEMMHTSGTTGEPKIAVRSHGNVLAAARNSIRGFGYTGSDVIAIAMPLSHSSALNSQLVPLLQLGGTVLLIDRFDADQMLNALREHHVTCMRLVPSMLSMLLAREVFDGARLPAVRLLVNSSAPVQPAELTALKRRFPSVDVMDSYGLTEASTCTVLVVDPLRERPGAVGRAIEGVEIRVMDPAGQPAATGQEGEVVVRGDHVFSGYLDKPEDTAKVVRDGWLWTGDMGRMEAEGEIYLHGRKADVIHCSGFKVHPAVVERCIGDLPEVDSVVVVGMPHKYLGEVVKAFVVSRDANLAPARVIHHCARWLSSHEVPFRVEIVDALPLGATGKVLRKDLKEPSR